MFSLCIPTLNRFDTFLNKNLQMYITYDLIDEIIICDENGNDYNKINEHYKEYIISEKIKIYKNENILGPFLNKLKVSNLASNEWVVLMDSDNFADYTYFEKAKDYILLNTPSKYSIISPSFAKPTFDYRKYEGKIYKKGNLFDNGCLINTGNYIINKYLINNVDISKEHENIKKSSACDVVFFNILLFEQFDLEFHVIKDMHYEHVIHNGSIYHMTSNNFIEFNKFINNKYLSMI